MNYLKRRRREEEEREGEKKKEREGGRSKRGTIKGGKYNRQGLGEAKKRKGEDRR